MRAQITANSIQLNIPAELRDRIRAEVPNPDDTQKVEFAFKAVRGWGAVDVYSQNWVLSALLAVKRGFSYCVNEGRVQQLSQNLTDEVVKWYYKN